MSADGDLSRPRPQYGEYATPEEQRARIRQPDVTAALDTGQSPDEVASASAHRPAAGKPGSSGPGVRSEDGAAAAPARATRGRSIDRIVTIALLAYGFVTMIGAIPAFIDYGTYASNLLETMGVDAELSDPAAGRPWAIAASLVLAFGWMVTAALAAWSMRRGRLSWWIALTGGVVFTFISGLLIVVPLLSDPEVLRAMQSFTIGGLGG
ncbi:DUF6264 family protein [Microbacterium sp. ARD31]|uniref:DUF6264 family protein n=1 Tax=Microbacterium sp. ARD31 TaxID=2962576 RepID=UPI0028823B1F|nr:DUF6264 family protein [Microbacterium sp. ARD31]MDT0180047.1 DUF6264 family protein [Microbacterium sp. ARD31]